MAVTLAEHYFLYPDSNSMSLVVWDMERQHMLGQLEGHDAVIETVAARGSLAVSCQRFGPVRARVWNLETMQCTATLPVGEDDAATSSACCMDGKLLLGQEDGIIKVWDIAASTAVALANLEGHTDEVYNIKAAAAGSMVLSGSGDKTVRLLDLRTGSGGVRIMEGHSKAVWSVDMDGNCRTAVSGSDDKMIKVWDLGSGQCLDTYEGHADSCGVIDVAMHESGSSFISAGHDSDIVNFWAVGSTRSIMRADVASSWPSSWLPNIQSNPAMKRLFASRDFSTVAFCSIGSSHMGLSVWR